MEERPESLSPFGAEGEPSKEKPERFEALIVYGENIKTGYPPEKIRNLRFYLSPFSKFCARAAGEIYQSGLVDRIIFSSGHTAGKDVPSEARAMYDYMKRWRRMRRLPEIPEDAVILEEESMETSGNAERVAKILDKYDLKHVALLAIGFHLERAKTLSKNYGIELSKGFAAEEAIRKPLLYERFLRRYNLSGIVNRESEKESWLKCFLILDSRGRIPRMVAEKTRGAEK